MKTLITRLTERGQVSVPAVIRRALHLEPGSKLCWGVVSDAECRVTVWNVRQPVGAMATRGYARQFRPVKRTAEWMAELRAGETS